MKEQLKEFVAEEFEDSQEQLWGFIDTMVDQIEFQCNRKGIEIPYDESGEELRDAILKEITQQMIEHFTSRQ